MTESLVVSMPHGRTRMTGLPLRRSVESNPKDVAALNNLAYVLARRGEDLDTAEKLIDDAIGLEGAVPDLVDTRALVYLAKGQHAEALAVISPLAKPRAPAGLHLRMAECLWKLKRFPEARQALDLAKRNGFKIDDLLPLDRVPTEQMLRELDAALAPGEYRALTVAEVASVA